MQEILMTPDVCMKFLVWSYYYHDLLPEQHMSYKTCGRFSEEDALRLDELKIDKSFIPADTSDESSKSMLMLKGVVNLAKSLGLTIVAEGVETPEQLALIDKMGVSIVQGYIFDKPLTENDFVERLHRKVYPKEQ